MRNYLILTFLLSSLSSWSCSDINLQTKSGSPLHKIPTYNQDGLGACYAYASSVLIDYQRMIKGYGGKGNLTHPIWLAMKYSKDRDKINGGYILETINQSSIDGICKESLVKKKLEEFKAANKISDAECVDFIQHVYNQWSVEKNETSNDVINAATENCWASKKITSSLYTQTTAPFKTHSNNVSKVIPTILLNQIMKDCNKKGNNYVPAIPKSLESCTKCSDNEIDKKIEKLLQSNQPIGISYCSTVLRNGNYQGIYNSRNDDLKWYTRSERVKLEKDKQAKSIDTKEKKRCGRHASVITGSRKYKGQCQYLLKNSWGDTSYKDHPNCICQRNNGSYFDCKRGDGNHNRVGCWVDSKKLTPNLFKLTHF